MFCFSFFLGAQWCPWNQYCWRKRKSPRRYPNIYCHDSGQRCGCTYTEAESKQKGNGEVLTACGGVGKEVAAMGTSFKVGIPTAIRDPCWGQNALEKVYTWNSLGPWAYKNIIVFIKASRWKKKLQLISKASHTVFFFFSTSILLKIDFHVREIWP